MVVRVLTHFLIEPFAKTRGRLGASAAPIRLYPEHPCILGQLGTPSQGDSTLDDIPILHGMDTALDDDYVISLLKRDADANKSRYLSSGLSPLLSSGRKANAPKPNTRFLRNVLRETEGHNKALKAKEEEEARKRARDINESRTRRKDGERKGRWASVLGGLGEGSKKRDRDAKNSECEGLRKRRRCEETDEDTRQAQRRTAILLDESRPTTLRSPQELPKRKRRKSEDLNLFPLALAKNKQSETERPHRREGPQNTEGVVEADDSDPLDSVIGPKPAPEKVPRGRGALHTSTIDARFHADYDPKSDIDTDHLSDNDDWAMALEAVRSRAKRLRAAGFSDAELKRWETSGRDKDVEDVRWKKKGEGREWDAGKTLDRGAEVKVKAEWVGRLKAT